jgi:hypothetical protein
VNSSSCCNKPAPEACKEGTSLVLSVRLRVHQANPSSELDSGRHSV